jgi:V/A-type H+-transporting ATPase subunit C
VPDYGYHNARLRGMKTRLVSAGEYDRMLKAADVSEMIDVAGRSGLKPALDTALIRYAGLEALESALKSDFVAHCRKVLSIADGRQRKLIGLLLLRWDVFNVKTILRGKHSHASPVELAATVVPAGELDDAALEELSAQPGVSEAVNLLATWGWPLAQALVDQLAAYLADKNLMRLELSLDRAYFDHALKETSGHLRNSRLVNNLLRSEIDVANIMAKIRLVIDDISTFVENQAEKSAREKQERAEARRLKDLGRVKPPKLDHPRARPSRPFSTARKPPPPIQDYFIPGGLELGGTKLVEMLRLKSMGDMLAYLALTSFARFISVDMSELETIPDLSAFERTLEADLVRKMTALYRREPLGIAMAISYLWMKYAEFNNLRIIGRGKEFGIPEHILRNELVHAF